MKASSLIHLETGISHPISFIEHPGNIIEATCEGDITTSTVDGCYNALRAHLAEGQKYLLLLDLSQANPPYGETRHHMQEKLATLTKVRHIAVFNGNNYYLNLIVQNLLGDLEGVTTSIHSNKEEALELLTALSKPV